MRAQTLLDVLLPTVEFWPVEDPLYAFILDDLPEATPPAPRAVPLGVACRTCGCDYLTLNAFYQDHGACDCPALTTWAREGGTR